MKTSTRRRAAASLEAVLATAIMLPISCILLVGGYRACKMLWQAISALVGWPYL